MLHNNFIKHIIPMLFPDLFLLLINYYDFCNWFLNIVYERRDCHRSKECPEIL